MKVTELREMTVPELNQELFELKEQLFKLRFQHATNQLDNPLELKMVRRDIARVKTILREIEIAEEKKQEDKV
ncbi:MAG: 50S ribosomal protein L29 [Clostridiaceae bacterium]|nr:50S ribosomal protein L29 [Clostridiaceae bacterium]